MKEPRRARRAAAPQSTTCHGGRQVSAMAWPVSAAAPPPSTRVSRTMCSDAFAGIKCVHAVLSACRLRDRRRGSPALQQLARRCPAARSAVDHDIAAMGEPERVIGVLLDQEDGELVALVERADGGEDLLHHQRRQPERRLVEQQQPRPAHQRAADRQHLLLAARERAAALLPALAQARKQREHPLEIGGRNRRRRSPWRRSADSPSPSCAEKCAALRATARCASLAISCVGSAVMSRPANGCCPRGRGDCRTPSSSASICRRRWRRSAQRSRPRATSTSTPLRATTLP